MSLRPPRLRVTVSSIALSVFLSVFALAAPALAAEPLRDEGIGTTPALGSRPIVVQEACDPAEPSLAVPAPDAATGNGIASDPPRNWAVAYAGLRPHLGTFGGLLTIDVAQSRTERFYGGLSFATVRNDAGTHVGALQLAFGRNLSDTFVGGLQLSLTENRARDFYGIGQQTLAYNRAGAFYGLWQMASYNRVREMTGLIQLGGYNRADEAFSGLAQVGALDHAVDFNGVAQLGVVAWTGDDLLRRSDGHFAGVVQAGALATDGGDFFGVAQVGAASNTSGRFRGVLQLGALVAHADDFAGFAQVGAGVVSRRSAGLQLGGVALATDEHQGLQLGILGNYAGREVDGAQVGLVNVAERVRGVQIGLFNHARSLRGVQIGLANHAVDGILPWTGLINMGFGDGDGGGTQEQARR